MSTTYNPERSAPICRHCKARMEWHSTHHIKRPNEAVLDAYRCVKCERIEVVTVQVKQVA